MALKSFANIVPHEQSSSELPTSSNPRIHLLPRLFEALQELKARSGLKLAIEFTDFDTCVGCIWHESEDSLSSFIEFEGVDDALSQVCSLLRVLRVVDGVNEATVQLGDWMAEIEKNAIGEVA